LDGNDGVDRRATGERGDALQAGGFVGFGTAISCDEVLRMVAGVQAIKRVGTAADIAGTVCFLSSEDSAFLTGQAIVADGGLMRV
jgi:NAD(P)-dependent dehydrogenase (short-subunit alcohol dehydrogenase family)